MKLSTINILLTFILCLNASSLLAQQTDGRSDELEYYFSFLENKSEAIAESAPESEYNELFSNIYKSNNNAVDTCRYITLPPKIKVYIYDCSFSHADGDTYAEDILRVAAETTPIDSTSFVPYVDVGKKVIYLEPDVERTLLNYLGKPHNHWEGQKLFRNYSEEEEEKLEHRLRLLRKYIYVGQFASKADWFLNALPAIPVMYVGKNELFMKVEPNQRAFDMYLIFLNEKESVCFL